MTRTIVVATANPHKVAEITAILADIDANFVPMSQFGVEPPVEDGATFEDNAVIKARACAAATGHYALADDSGLEVDVLDGQPGVFSARYAGEGATDDDNNQKLVAQLQEQPDDNRHARFVCAAALCSPQGEVTVVRAEMPGYVIEQPRGTHGFGYDPHFVSDAGGGRTNAELSPEEKDLLSHRGAAFRQLRPTLERVRSTRNDR